jgi:hypothetical protein
MGFLRVVILVALACGSGSCGDDAPPPPRSHTVSLSWRVTDLSDVELACDRIDARSVTVTFTRLRTGESLLPAMFDCASKTGTRLLEEDDYLIGFELADPFGTLVTLPPKRYSITAATAIEEAKLRLDPFGDLEMTLETPQQANCSAGSQITGMTIEMYRSGGACQTSTLAIEPSTTYTINCTSPNVTGCIEKDRRVTATHFPADEYRIRVVALQGANPCWVHDQRHRIRAAGLRRTVVLPLTKSCT